MENYQRMFQLIMYVPTHCVCVCVSIQIVSAQQQRRIYTGWSKKAKSINIATKQKTSVRHNLKIINYFCWDLESFIFGHENVFHPFEFEWEKKLSLHLHTFRKSLSFNFKRGAVDVIGGAFNLCESDVAVRQGSTNGTVTNVLQYQEL